jgi:hypothetical protein
MPLKQHPTDPDKLVYAPREYDLPTKREWIGLTDEDKAQCIQATAQRGLADELIAAIETKLKEKNHV